MLIKIFKIIFRIIILPLIFAIALLVLLKTLIKMCYKFIRYGGEFITYDKDTAKTIKDIYNHLNNKIKTS